MGHRNDDALLALRAYARDLDATQSSGSIQIVGGSDQDGARDDTPGSSGAPHQLAIAAVAVSAVLIGSIGISAAMSSSNVNIGAVESLSPVAESQPDASTNLATSQSVTNAARAFNAFGLVRSAAAIELAIATGMESDPAFMAALEDVEAIIARSMTEGRALDESAGSLQLAVLALEESATLPPGLDPDRVQPGQGGTPPGQDPTFTPPGQDPTFTPPGQDPTFTPPGQDPTFTPPGQNGDATNPNGTNGSGNSQRPDNGGRDDS